MHKVFLGSIFLDTNILLDVVSTSRPMSEASSELILKALTRGVRCLCGAASLKDVYYVYERMTCDEPAARAKFRGLRSLFDVATLDSALIDAALDSDEPDFEDGIIRAQAESFRVDAIVSNDADAFLHSPICKVTSLEAIDML